MAMTRAQVGSVAGRANARRNGRHQRNAEISRLFDDGLSAAEIGRRHGISRQRVFQILHAGRRQRTDQTPG